MSYGLSFLERRITMKKMLKRDIDGSCRFSCRNRVLEGQYERQLDINFEPYSEPLSDSPDWVKSRKDQPGVYGGRI